MDLLSKPRTGLVRLVPMVINLKDMPIYSPMPAALQKTLESSQALKKLHYCSTCFLG